MRLWTSREPSGRCVLLVKALHDATRSKESVRLAEELFAQKRPADAPVVLDVTDPGAVAELRRLCDEYGVEIELAT